MNIYFPFFLIAVAVLIWFVIQYRKSSKGRFTKLGKSNKDPFLRKRVAFYNSLNSSQKTDFVQRLEKFLNLVRLTPVGEDFQLTDEDKLLIGSSAIIPIFNYPDWEYKNLSEIIVYPDAFPLDFDANNPERSILGLVGEGAFQRTMVLSLAAVVEGFSDATDGHNTGIHEFVHLLDKADGETNGIPYYMLQKNAVNPWLHYMHEEMEKIREDKSAINSYAATNEAEFFAVAAEYFFEKPEMLQENHPELYAALEQIFKPQEKIV